MKEVRGCQKLRFVSEKLTEMIIKIYRIDAKTKKFYRLL